MTELARINPAQRIARAVPPVTRDLTPRQKAAVITRLLLAEGAAPPIANLPDHLQAALAEQMAQMRLIDRSTLAAVVEEFLSQLEEVGLSFPGGLAGALSIMDGHLSSSAANRLRRMAGVSERGDPWERLVQVPIETMIELIEVESAEIAAVALSKLPVPRAAEILQRLPGERARRIAYAVSTTGNVDPDTVRRIGISLVGQIDARPPRAFAAGPVDRVGAILNVTASQTRDTVLTGLQAEDAEFAEQVRQAIFTFGHIPARIAPRDVPKIVRLVAQPDLVTAIAAALGTPLQPAADHLLAHMSPRLAQGLREDVAARGRPREKEAEAAMAAIVTAIRDLIDAGDLAPILLEVEEESPVGPPVLPLPLDVFDSADDAEAENPSG